MRYFVTLAGRSWQVDLDADGIRLDGEPVSAELAALAGTDVHHLLLDGQSWTLVAEPGDESGQWDIQIDGVRLTADVVDERTQAIRAMTGQAAGPRGPRPVKAPMPGMIVRVLVELGTRVSAGQGVAIIEAMKMENELKAEADGVVSRIAAEAGAAVEKGTVLIEFEAPAEDA